MLLQHSYILPWIELMRIKTEQIVNNAQNAQEKGWKAFESRKNRYWLIENILNDRFRKNKPPRKA